ncbi:hypothetical protein Fmac_020931 [Flemingia macrophylla]|uniref:ATPase AAA-type core domain-containing protein n=1 Tax=Flemingia macrophylla TaxID=520843 RepID=A0ABD1LVI3_9FABA
MTGSRSSSNSGLPLAKVKQQWPILGGREDQISMVKRELKNRANILLHGPKGCGKTMFVHAIANETAQPFYELSGKAPHMIEARKSSYDVIVTTAATQPDILSSDFVEMFAFCIQLDLPDKAVRMKMVPLIVKHLQGKDLAYDVVSFMSDNNEENSVTEFKEFLRKFMSK